MGQAIEQKQMYFFQKDLIGIIAKPAILVTCLKIPIGETCKIMSVQHN